MISINSQFHAGSIEVINIKNKVLDLRIRKDTNSHFAQWFYFQISGAKDKEITVNFHDMDKTAYPSAWKNYNICASYDNLYWFRLPTDFDNKSLMSAKFTPENNVIYLAYFEPYSETRHHDLITNSLNNPHVNHEVLGQTYLGRNIDLLTVGNKKAKNKIWIIARQHPGETMAEWFMEGLLNKLLDGLDPVSNKLLKENQFFIVPNTNPDGSALGNLRTNALGVNLNREWENPSLEKSPEVYHVRKKIHDTGVSMFFDIHGDEELEYFFTDTWDIFPEFDKKQQKNHSNFQKLLLAISPDYQTKHGYPKGHFNDEAKTIGTYHVGSKFNCLALTLEMPFKDNANNPQPEIGWNGYRSYLLGQTLLNAILLYTDK